MSPVVNKLQKRLEQFAFLWILLHIGIYAYIGSRLNSYGDYVRLTSKHRIKRTTAIMFIIASSVELMACVLLFLGAKFRIKSLLFPCMFLMAVVYMFFGALICILVAMCLFGLWKMSLEDLGILIFGLAMLLILFALNARMLKTTRKFFDELWQCSRTVHNSAPADVEMNMAPLHVNLSNINQSNIASNVPNVSPPQYNAISTVSNSNPSNIAPTIPNQSPSQYNETSAAPNVTQCNMVVNLSNEPPSQQYVTSAIPNGNQYIMHDPLPQYSEICATLNAGSEVPPTYDEAMNQHNIWQWLKKQNI